MKKIRNIETSKSQRIHEIIPGGAHTYSKGDDQFPVNAPRFITRGSGASIWDEAGREYVDFAMSLGTTVLGHAYAPVDNAAINAIHQGINFCRPSLLEGELAELLIDKIPSAEMVKFGKNGSDAVTAAIKLARAYTGKDYIARCGSDPFNAVHDWFIGSTVVDRGVPQSVSALTLKFKYNDIDSCKELFEKYHSKIACFILEPLSFEEPTNNFLAELKLLCEENDTLLIFDEVVSGFRFSVGGAQKYLGVTPHLSAFGKAMANGYPISALVGQADIMKLGGIHHEEERVFLLSSTYGGDTPSISAAIKTINEIDAQNAITHFWSVGEKLIENINSVSNEYGFGKNISGFGYGCKPAIQFSCDELEPSPALRTLFMQEMLNCGIMLPYIVPSLAHTDAVLDKFYVALRTVMHDFSGNSVKELLMNKLKCESVKPVFRKYN